MPYNTNDLLRAIRQAAMEAVQAQKPSGVYFGTVRSLSPLAIQVGQKLTLGTGQLVCMQTARPELEVGTKVVLLREQGGQRYVVLGVET